MPNNVSTNTVTAAAFRTVVQVETSREEAQVAPQNGKNLPPEQPAIEISSAEAEALAERLSEFARSINRDLAFSVHEDSGKTVIQVLDSETNEIIRQIPSEELLRLSERLSDAQAILFDENA